MGALTPVGNTVEEFWSALTQGKSGIGPITKFDAQTKTASGDFQFVTRIAGEVRNFDELKYVDKKDARRLDPYLKYAMACAVMAVEDSGLDTARVDGTRFGVLIGSGIGGISSLLDAHRMLIDKGPDRVSPFFIPMLIVNMAAGLVSMRFGAKGPNSAVVTACATGNHALGDAFRLIQRGDADVMIAGGAEAIVVPLTIAGFCSMKAMSTRNDEPAKASRPFDRERDGFVIGEGAGVVILEELGHAVRRGARIYSEVAGYGLSGDAYHVSAPSEDGDGPIRVMRNAIRDAGVDPSAIDYVNAHGTSTPQGDVVESKALKAVFGERARKLAVSSTKSMTGHLLGGAGGLETAITALSVFHDQVPPTINYTTPDPECDLDYVPNESRRMKVRHALNNSFGFGGTNAALVLKKYEG